MALEDFAVFTWQIWLLLHLWVHGHFTYTGAREFLWHSQLRLNAKLSSNSGIFWPFNFIRGSPYESIVPSFVSLCLFCFRASTRCSHSSSNHKPKVNASFSIRLSSPGPALLEASCLEHNEDVLCVESDKKRKNNSWSSFKHFRAGVAKSMRWPTFNNRHSPVQVELSKRKYSQLVWNRVFPTMCSVWKSDRKQRYSARSKSWLPVSRNLYAHNNPAQSLARTRPA